MTSFGLLTCNHLVIVLLRDTLFSKNFPEELLLKRGMYRYRQFGTLCPANAAVPVFIGIGYCRQSLVAIPAEYILGASVVAPAAAVAVFKVYLYIASSHATLPPPVF